jgi:hypothetical protein
VVSEEEEEEGAAGGRGVGQERGGAREAKVEDAVPSKSTEVGEPSSEGPKKVNKFEGQPGEVVELVESL